MAQEDLSLTSSLQKLQIEASTGTKKKTSMPKPETNPLFTKRRRSKSLSSVGLFGPTCSCSRKPSLPIKHDITFKRSRKRILREPILKLIAKCHHKTCVKLDDKKDFLRLSDLNTNKSKLFGHCASKRDYKDFRSVLSACQQLNLANINDGVADYSLQSFHQVRPAPNQSSNVQRLESGVITATCSHQARMNVAPPCDVTIDELASYFETFVHIPKKMSSMAEMMYT